MLRTGLRIDGVFTAPIGDYDEMAADAAYAHALVTAIQEFRAAPLDTSLTFPSDAVDWLEWRDSELMREWGFEEKVTP